MSVLLIIILLVLLLGGGGLGYRRYGGAGLGGGVGLVLIGAGVMSAVSHTKRRDPPSESPSP